MDEELLRLQEQLMSVQMAEAAHQMSEVNCVEVILKLVESKRLDIIYTKSGREYVTPEHLIEEVQDEVLAHGGRLAIVELPALLNVDMSYIEEAVHQIVSRDASCLLVNQQIVTGAYMDSIMQETNDTLQNLGQLALSELGQRFSLPTAVVTAAVNARLGSMIAGQVRDGVLYTDAFVDMHAARVRGAFSALMQPTTVRSMVSEYGFLEALAYKEVTRLIERKELAASLTGSEERATYVPDVFSKQQRESVDTFFSQNDYIETSTLAQLQVSDPSAYMKQMFPDAVKLSSCYLAPHTVETVVGALEELAVSKTWVDVSVFLPPPLTDRDTAQVLQQAIRKANATFAGDDGKAVPVQPNFAVSTVFIEQCQALALPYVRSLAAKAPQPGKESPGDDDDDDDGDDAEEDDDDDDGGAASNSKSKRSKRGKKKQKKGKRRGDDDDDDDDDDNDQDDDGRRSKKKNKKKDKKKSKKKKAAASSSSPSSSSLFSEAAVAKLLKEKIPECPPLVIQHIVRSSLSSLLAAFKDAQQSIRSGGASDRRKLHEMFRAELQELYDHMQAFHKAIKTIEPDASSESSANDADDAKNADEAAAADEDDDKKENKDTARALHRHLLKTVCVQAFDVLLKTEALHNNLTFAGSPTALPKPGSEEEKKKPDEAQKVVKVSWSERIAFLSALPPARSKALQAVVPLLKQKQSDAFVEGLEAVASDAGLRVKSLDKKKERSLVFNIRRGLMAQLEGVQRPRLVLQYTVLIVFSQLTNTIAHCPAKAVHGVLRYLKGKIAQEPFDKLTRLSAAVVAEQQGSSKGRKDDDDDEDDDEDDEDDEDDGGDNGGENDEGEDRLELDVIKGYGAAPKTVLLKK